MLSDACFCIVLYIPVQIAVCIIFLYNILGWRCVALELVTVLTKRRFSSAFVGLFVMVILFPIPGYVAKKTQSVQKEKMNKVGLISFRLK